MCILIEQPVGYNFSLEQIKDLYAKNQHGIGVMYHTEGGVGVAKALPKDATQAYKWYRDYAAGKHCFIHLRMQTHGDIDMTNCHPYEVPTSHDDYQLYLMHNGVLETGNLADETKSDTWHYARDYITKIVDVDKDLLFSSVIHDLLLAHIGDTNKFALMDSEGRSMVVNREAGIWHEDCWYSNTYAWSAPISHSAVMWDTRWGHGDEGDLMASVNAVDFFINDRDNGLVDGVDSYIVSDMLEVIHEAELYARAENRPDEDTLETFLNNAPTDAVQHVLDLLYELAVGGTAINVKGDDQLYEAYKLVNENAAQYATVSLSE